jgi:uncharacterized membrane protein
VRRSRSFEQLLAAVLRAGVIVSAAVVACGGAVYLVRNGSTTAQYGAFTGEPEALRSIAGMITPAATFSGRGIIQLGLLLLIATPIARVVVAVLGFISRRDWLYAMLGSVVLLLLGYAAIAP